MKVKKLFDASILFGAVLLFATFAIIVIPTDSPYRFGRLAGTWSIAQLGSATLFLYAGIMGGFATMRATDHWQMRPWVGIISVGIVMTLVIWTLAMILLEDRPVAPPSSTDVIVAWVARGCVILSLFVGVLAEYYLYWVLCWQRKANKS